MTQRAESLRICPAPREDVFRAAVGNLPLALSRRVGGEGVCAEAAKHGEVPGVPAVVVGGQGQERTHRPLKIEDRCISHSEWAGLATPVDCRGIDAVLLVVGVGEIIKPVLHVGFADGGNREERERA